MLIFFNQMFWYFYGTIWCVVLSIGEILQFTILEEADFKFLYSLNYNDKILQEKFPKNKYKERIMKKS
jgi:hypothetical protein